MIQTSQAFIDAVNRDSREWRARWLVDGTETETTTKSIIVKGGSMGETALNLCGAYSMSLEAIVDSAIWINWENRIVQPQVGLVLEDESIEWVTLGTFTISEVYAGNYTTTLKGVGNLTAKGGAKFIAPAIQSVSNIVSVCSATMGVTINLDSSFAGSTVIDKEMINMSCMQALTVVASVVGGFVCDKVDGTILIGKYPRTATCEFTTARMNHEPTYSDYDDTINGVRVVVKEESTDEEGTTIPAIEYETEESNVVFQNEYMTESAFTNFANNLTGLTWRKANVELALGDPRIEATDLAHVTSPVKTYYLLNTNGDRLLNTNGDALLVDFAGMDIAVPVHNYCHRFDGGLQTTIIANGESESYSQSEQGGQVSRQLKQIVADLITAKEAIIERVKATELEADVVTILDNLGVAGHFFVDNQGVVHITETKNDYTTGRNILIDSDSLDIRDGETVLASFGLTTIIGEQTDTHIELSQWKLQAVDYNQNIYWIVGDLREGEIVANFMGDGTTTRFDLPASSTIATVKINGVETSDYTIGSSSTLTAVNFWDAPSSGAQIEITFTTETPVHYFIFGTAVGNVGMDSFNSGILSEASGNVSHAEGYRTTASGSYSHAEGNRSTASGGESHSEGNGTTASGVCSHAEGAYSMANGSFSHAEGSGTASGAYSHAEGNGTTASGVFSHAEGYRTKALPTADEQTLGLITASHAEGRETTASGGNGSHAEGHMSTASGMSSHAEGYSTKAVGIHAHAEGNGTYANGDYSHAEGQSSRATGESAHAEGNFTKAFGLGSHAEGSNTVAYGEGQHAAGKWNEEDVNGVYAEIIGNGTSGSRSNARTLDWNGNMWLAGGLELTAPNDTRYRITVDNNGKLVTTAV